MVISYAGVGSFRIQFGDTVIAYNPISKDSSYKAQSFGADIVLVAANHPDMNGVAQASRKDKEPFVVSGPGEYEIGGIFVQGFPAKTLYGGEERLSTVYLMELEGMNLCFLGPLSSADELSAETKEALDDIDVLFAPIGGEGTLGPADTHKLAVKLAPHLIIPMHYEGKEGKTALAAFLKEAGAESSAAEAKLTIKKKDLEGKENEVVVLSPTA
jgi:L-ascorbate metabolism protein UlaG (beta-lactamase superfamily)